MKRKPKKALANLVDGERALTRHARIALLDRRKRPPEAGEAIPAAPPEKPKPIIDGAQAPIE